MLLDSLVKRHFLRTVSGAGNRVMKYEQHFCNSEFGDLKLNPPEVALVATLLLRSAQTPGELRFRTARMYEFSCQEEVEACLQCLANREDGPFVARLPREAGKRESRYRHLFGDDTASDDLSSPVPAGPDNDLYARVEGLEAEVAQLKARLASLLDSWGK